MTEAADDRVDVNGGNVPGKKRMYMGYTGGIPEYPRRCDEIAAQRIRRFQADVGD